MATLLLATWNRGKIEEFGELLRPLGLHVVGLDRHPEVALPPETGATFEENARLKAVSAAQLAGLPALADDSGLCVDYLGGAPGVLSARFGGGGLTDHQKCALLLERLAAASDAERGASFHCTLALALPSGEVRCVHGETRGRILRDLRGTSGFGYDPLFLVPELGRTYAELSPGEKHQISHRGRAAAQLPALLEAWPAIRTAGAR